MPPPCLLDIDWGQNLWSVTKLWAQHIEGKNPDVLCVKSVFECSLTGCRRLHVAMSRYLCKAAHAHRHKFPNINCCVLPPATIHVHIQLCTAPGSHGHQNTVHCFVYAVLENALVSMSPYCFETNSQICTILLMKILIVLISKLLGEKQSYFHATNTLFTAFAKAIELKSIDNTRSTMQQRISLPG